MSVDFRDNHSSLSATLDTAAQSLHQETITVAELIGLVGEQGLLILSAVLTLPFLLPISIPGVSTVFGAVIVLAGVAITLNRILWLPKALSSRAIPAETLKPFLQSGHKFAARMERIIRMRWLAITSSARLNRLHGLTIVAAGLMLMLPFGLVPFSNTLPALVILLIALGLIERDGVLIVGGYVALLGTLVYFGVLLVLVIATGNTLL
ncbi:MAG: exopolysaccharide biosynthesis protein [Anaerolineae bacterium]